MISCGVILQDTRETQHQVQHTVRRHRQLSQAGAGQRDRCRVASKLELFRKGLTRLRLRLLGRATDGACTEREAGGSTCKVPRSNSLHPLGGSPDGPQPSSFHERWRQRVPLQGRVVGCSGGLGSLAKYRLSLEACATALVEVIDLWVRPERYPTPVLLGFLSTPASWRASNSGTAGELQNCENGGKHLLCQQTTYVEPSDIIWTGTFSSQSRSIDEDLSAGRDRRFTVALGPPSPSSSCYPSTF